MRNQKKASAALQTRCSGRRRRAAAAAEVPDLAALPPEVLANVVAKLPACEAIQLQRVSRCFRRAGAAGGELQEEVAIKLSKVLREDGRSGRAALAACAARRWLARTAAGIKRIGTYDTMGPAAWTSLICCLPALEHAFLHFDGDLVSDDVACLLEALAGCPRLKSLSLLIYCFEDAEDGGLSRPIPDASAFAKLSSLTYLALRSWEADCFIVPDVVAALASLTALAELNLDLPQAAVVPAALGRCKGLRSLALSSFSPCVLEVGCLELPNLQSLEFNSCDFDEDLRLLPGVSALQQLTRLEFQGNQAVCEFDPGLVRLGHLQRLVLSPDNLRCAGSVDAAPPRLLWLPADMGLLSLSLLHLDLAGL